MIIIIIKNKTGEIMNILTKIENDISEYRSSKTKIFNLQNFIFVYNDYKYLKNNPHLINYVSLENLRIKYLNFLLEEEQSVNLYQSLPFIKALHSLKTYP